MPACPPAVPGLLLCEKKRLHGGCVSFQSCACACVCACVCVCVRARVFVCGGAYACIRVRATARLCLHIGMHMFEYVLA